MNRIVLLTIVFALGCNPGAISVDSGESSSGSESTTDEGTTADDPPDTGDPLPPPTSTCEASVFVLDDTYDYSSVYIPSAPIVVRDDGSVVVVHADGVEYISPNFRVRAWSADGSPIWEAMFPGLEQEGNDTTLAADEFGDLYLSHHTESAFHPTTITKFSGDAGVASWTYETGTPGGANQRVVDMHFDADGILLAAMTLNHGQMGSNFVVEALDPDNGMEIGWHAEWDGPDDEYGYSYDHAAGLAVDRQSGRVFAAGNDNFNEMVVVAWDPPSTEPVWVVRPFEGDLLGWVAGLELTTAGGLIVLEHHRPDTQSNELAPRMLALDPDDGHTTWWADSSDLGFEPTKVIAAIDMVSTPDGGVAVSGYIPVDSALLMSDGFLLRLDGDLLPYCLDIADFGMDGQNVLKDIDVTPSGQLFAGGWTYAHSSGGAYDYRGLIARWE